MSTNTPNTIDLYLMENRSIMAKVNGYPIGNQNGYLIIAGEENATQFKIASIPDIYSGYTLSVEMVNSRGAGIEEKEIEDNTFVLPEGMAVAGYGQIQIYAKKTVSGREIKVPFNLIRVKVSNTISTWEESISPGAVESAKKSAAEAKSYAESAKKDSESAATAASVAESSKEAAESAAQEATQSAQSAAESASTAQNAAEEAVNTLEGKADLAGNNDFTGENTFEEAIQAKKGTVVKNSLDETNYNAGYISRNDWTYLFPADSGTFALTKNIPTDYATQTALANTQRQVDGLYTLLEQKNEIYVQTATDTYTTRETAGGENIADGVQTPVKKITGKTVKTTNLFSGENVTTGNCTYENGVAKQIAADNSSTLVWKAQLYKDTTFVSQVEVQFLNTGRTPALTFEKTSDVNRLAFGLNGSSVDTLLSIYISEFPNGEYTITWNVLNTTQGSISWNDIMLNEGSTALPYMPYFSGLKNAFFKEIVSTGRNLIPYPYADGMSKAENGITFTVNTDGTITVNGTATAHAQFFLYQNKEELMGMEKGKTCICSMNDSSTNLLIYADYYSNGEWKYPAFTSTGSNFVVPDSWEGVQLYILVKSGETLSNLVLKPMLNYGSSALPYEPYTQSVLSLPEAVELTEYDTAYPETGEIQRQSNTLTFNGTETWNDLSDDTRYIYGINLPTPAVLAPYKGVICNLFPSSDVNGVYLTGTVDGTYKSLAAQFLKSSFPQFDSVTAWKAYLAAQSAAGNPLTVTYKTAEATTEQADFSADSYIAWKNGSETIEQGDTDNSIYGAENTVEQDYYLLTAPEEVTKE